MQYFATYFDRNYLPRGLALLESLKVNSSNFTLYILCLDNFTFDYFNNNSKRFPQVQTLLIDDIENEDLELAACKTNRKTIEYYFTLSPCLPLFILKKYQLPHICTLDADIKFYSSPDSLFKYLEEYSIVITPHKFSKEKADSVKYGKNNVSFQIFKNDKNGIKCLEYWRKQCIEWCEDELDEVNNRFADQKYLDNWEELYSGKVKVLFDNVSGLAPWNLNNYTIQKKNGKFYSNNERVIFFHFHHNKFLKNRWATNAFKEYSVVFSKGLLKIYKDYWFDVTEKIKLINDNNTDNSVRAGNAFGYIRGSLQSEDTVFFKINNYWIIFLRISKLSPFIKKILFKLYA